MGTEQTANKYMGRADVVRGVVASLIGMVLFVIADQMFHDQAAYYFEHTNPRYTPQYDELNLFFISLPYFVGSVATGLFAGAGRMTRLEFPLTRLVTGFGYYALANLAYTAFMHPWSTMRSLLFLLPGLLAFFCSLLADWLYREAQCERDGRRLPNMDGNPGLGLSKK